LNPVMMSFLLLGICAAYGTATLGPLPSAAYRSLTDRLAYAHAARNWALLAQVPDDANIAAGYALMPALSSRQHLTSLHYIALGVTQFAEKPYAPPEDLRMVALDADDLVTYRAQFLKTVWAAPHYDGWRKRLESVLGTPIYVDGALALYDRSSAVPPVSLAPQQARPPGKSAAPFADAVTTAQRKRIRFSIDLGPDQLPEGSVAHYGVVDAQGRTVIDDSVLVDSPMPWTSRNGGTTVQFAATVPTWAKWPLQPKVTVETSDSSLILNDVRTAIRGKREPTTVRSFELPALDQPK
jgi:hypothetical protein